MAESFHLLIDIWRREVEKCFKSLLSYSLARFIFSLHQWFSANKQMTIFVSQNEEGTDVKQSESTDDSREERRLREEPEIKSPAWSPNKQKGNVFIYTVIYIVTVSEFIN